MVGLVIAAIFLRPEDEVVEEVAPPPAEVTPDELIRSNGVMYWKGTSDPFDGLLVERYPESDGLKSRTTFMAGLMHDVSEGFFTNSQIQVREFFTNGVSHGIRTKWRSDGTLLSEGTIVAGEFHGAFRKFYTNGNVSHSRPGILIVRPLHQIEAPIILPGGIMRLRFGDRLGLELESADLVRYQLQKSEDLIHWSDAAGASRLIGGSIEIDTVLPENKGEQFFRVVER